MSELLPKIQDRDHYQKIFCENHHWDRAISFLINRHSLKGDVKRGALGSHVVYQVGDSLIPLFLQNLWRGRCCIAIAQ